jgi:hypothetical protein
MALGLFSVPAGDYFAWSYIWRWNCDGIKVQSNYNYIVHCLVFRTQMLNLEPLALALVEVLRFVDIWRKSENYRDVTVSDLID